MNEITNTQKTMSSIELVNTINEVRREEGKAVLVHSDFLKKVAKVLNGAEGKFSSGYKDTNNQERKCYLLPKRECDLLVMSESYKVQAAVYDKMIELEEAKPKLTLEEEKFRDAQIALNQSREILKQNKRLDAIENVTEVRNGLIDMNTQNIQKTNVRVDIFETRKPALPFSGETTIDVFSRTSELSKEILKIAAKTYGISGRSADSYSPEGVPIITTFYKGVELYSAAKAWVDDSNNISRCTWKHRPTGKTFRPNIRL